MEQWVKEQYNYIAERFDNVTPPGEPTPETLFNAGVYEWGALGLHALRLEVSDDAFFDTLQTYVDRFKGENVTPEDFIGVAEEVSGQELDALFEQWFYSEELASIPELNLFAGTLESDMLYGTGAEETLTGLDSDDTIYGNGGTDTLIGNSGNDLLYGGSKPIESWQALEMTLFIRTAEETLSIAVLALILFGWVEMPPQYY